jgi:hypothetical protein
MRNLTTETRRHGGGSGCRSIGQAANIGNPEQHRVTQERGRDEGPRASVPSYAATGSSHAASPSFSWHFQNVWHTVCTVFREIFDESAYERFLLRTRNARSVASYREFMHEREAATVRRPRCC